MYDEGRGVPRNDAEAVKWCRLAADQGAAIAELSIGLMYSEGRGVPQNESEAVKWWRKVAEQGYAQAQYNLGLMYDKGRGVQQNFVQAALWYSLAEKQGNQDATRNLGLVIPNLTNAQLVEAHRLVSAWKSKSSGGGPWDDYKPDAPQPR